MELGIKGKVAMVAAASQGLGLAIAKALAEEGAQVSMAARKAETIRAAAARIVKQTGAEAMGWVADVISAEAIEGWHDATVERFGGVDLMLTSSSVKNPIPNLGLSNVMRPAVSALVKTFADEFAGKKIRVNQLVPGRIATERLTYLDDANAKRAGISLEEQRKRSMGAIPLGRYGDPEEFARAAAFLLSDAAGYITGATLQVDGGAIRSIG